MCVCVCLEREREKRERERKKVREREKDLTWRWKSKIKSVIGYGITQARQKSYFLPKMLLTITVNGYNGYLSHIKVS